MKYGSCCLVVTVSFLLSGCQLDMRSAVEDYNGNDAAKIRVLDKGVIGLVAYESEGDCYREVSDKKLTAAFHLSLISQADYSTGSAKSVGMVSPSSFGNKTVKEYSIKPGEFLEVVNKIRQETYSSAVVNHKSSNFFIPEKNHEYEIYAEPSKYTDFPGNVIIRDLTTNEAIKSWTGTICKKEGFFS